MGRKINPIQLQEPKLTDSPKSIAGIALGLFLLALGVVMIISIIFIIPGIAGVALGIVFLALSIPKTDAVCPECGTDNRAQLYSKSLECEGCGRKTPIKWYK